MTILALTLNTIVLSLVSNMKEDLLVLMMMLKHSIKHSTLPLDINSKDEPRRAIINHLTIHRQLVSQNRVGDGLYVWYLCDGGYFPQMMRLMLSSLLRA